MDLKLLNKEGNKLVFAIRDTNPTFVNTLRRIIASELPTMAIKRVTFVKNNSALFDEILAHRLGMLPIITDLSSYELSENCSCKGSGCAKCQVVLTLKAEGPLTVYASDLKFQDPKIKPVHAKMPIVKLLKGQELEFEAIASLGTGKEHAKFSPGLAHYKGYPKIEIDKLKNPEEVFDSCPLKVFDLKGKQLSVANLESCTLCMACVDTADPKEGIIVAGSEKDFIFTIESWGKLPAEEILSKALDVLDEKLDEFVSQLNKAK